jgi:hypothetical protein
MSKVTRRLASRLKTNLAKSIHTGAIGTTVHIPIEDSPPPMTIKRHRRSCSSLVHGRTRLPNTIQGPKSVSKRRKPAAGRAARPACAGVDDFHVVSAPGGARAHGAVLLEGLGRVMVRAVVVALRVTGDLAWFELVDWSLSLSLSLSLGEEAMRVTTGDRIRLDQGNPAIGRAVHWSSGDLVWWNEHVSRGLGLGLISRKCI